jgi:hypothetical protein
LLLAIYLLPLLLLSKSITRFLRHLAALAATGSLGLLAGGGLAAEARQ